MRALGHGLAALAALAALPLGAGALLVRPRWWRGLPERLGAWPHFAPGGVWLHASAVGEVRASLGLIDALAERGLAVRASTFTLEGRAALREWRDDPPCHLAPIDHPWCVEAALRRVRPSLLALVETELWPSWIAAAERLEVPVVVVSGRLSDRSLAGYRRFGGVFRRALGRITAVGARSDLDAERFIALGAPESRVSVTGDLKLDLEGAPRPPGEDLATLLGAAPLIVAGSTRPGEERLWLDALERIEQGGAAPALVLVPRQPSRAREVERLAARRGRRVRLRSRPGAGELGAGDVLVVDTLGELASLYGRSSVAFVGGTLVPVGGHNVLEPVLAGRPVLYGPHTGKVRHAVEILETSGAGRVAADADELARAALAWLADPEKTRALGAAGRAALEPHRGSTARSAALIERVLAGREPPPPREAKPAAGESQSPAEAGSAAREPA